MSEEVTGAVGMRGDPFCRRGYTTSDVSGQAVEWKELSASQHIGNTLHGGAVVMGRPEQSWLAGAVLLPGWQGRCRLASSLLPTYAQPGVA